MKPRVRYADIFKPLDLSALEYEKTELLLDGKPCVYAGHHHELTIWLRHGSRVQHYKQAEVLPRLKLRQGGTAL